MTIKKKSLMGSNLLEETMAGEENPMDSMGNLMDVMLVFACGLMIALIAHYNVQLVPSDIPEGNVEHIDQDLEQVSEGISQEDGNYTEVGTVYRDADTGELYVLAPEGTDLSGM